MNFSLKSEFMFLLRPLRLPSSLSFSSSSRVWRLGPWECRKRGRLLANRSSAINFVSRSGRVSTFRVFAEPDLIFKLLSIVIGNYF